LATAFYSAVKNIKGNKNMNKELTDSVNIKRKYYKNGLHAAVVKNSLAEDVVEIRIYVKTGSVYEKDFYGSGISHFLEHLTAEGPTETKSKKEVDRLIEKFGNHFNAYTTKDHTCYHITTTKEFYPEALNLLSELVFENRITKEAFKRERGVIQREIEKSLEEPGRYLHRITSENLYRVHPSKYPVIGYRDLFEKIMFEDIKTYYGRTYRPNNAFIVVGGDIDSSLVFKKIDAAAGGYTRGFLNPPVLPAEPMLTSVRERTGYRDIEGGYLDISWLTIAIDHEDLYALDLLSEILSSGRNARLNKIIKEEKNLVNSIGSYSYTPSYGKGNFTINARFKDTDPDDIERNIFEIIEAVKVNGVTQKEMSRAKKLARTEYLFGSTSVSGITARAGIDILSTSDEYFAREYLRNLKETTADEVQQAAEKYLSLSRYAKTLLLPKDSLSGDKKQRIFPDISPKIVPELFPEKVKFDNGVTVILKNMPGISVINYDFFFKGGVTYDKVYDTPGLFSFMSSMLSRGTKKYDRVAINERFEERGASFSASSGNNTFYIKAVSLKEDSEEILNLLKEVITEPAFDTEEIAKLKKFTLQAITQQKNSWQKVGMLNYKKHIYPENMPYRESSIGTIESIDKIDRALLKKVHNDFVVGSNMVISVVGDFNGGKMKKRLKSLFGNIKASDGEIADYKKGILKRETPLNKQYSTDKDMAVILRGYPTVTIDEKATRIVLDVIDTLISGGSYPGGWLHERLRGEELVYVVHAYNMNHIKSGNFTIFAATNKENTNKALEVIDGVVNDLNAGKYTAGDIERAKEQIITSHKLNRQTPSAIAQNYALNEILGFGYDYDKEYLKKIEKVSINDIKETADKYFNNPVTVITSPK
jgi:zinc protease